MRALGITACAASINRLRWSFDLQSLRAKHTCGASNLVNGLAANMKAHHAAPRSVLRWLVPDMMASNAMADSIWDRVLP